MSVLTNRWGLPEAFVEAIKRDPYYAGGAELTASSIGSPPRIRALMRLHGNEIEEDVVDHLWKLLGNGVHTVLERAGRSEIREKRIFATIGGAQISAQLDSHTVVGGKITEFKVTSVWTVVYGGREEWVAQMNTQAEVLACNGIEPRELEVAAILRDWSKSKAEEAERRRKAGGEDSYPIVPVVLYAIPLWPRAERVDYITGRVVLHRAAALGDMPVCSPEERWERKPGQPTRCLSWCAVAPWCDFGQEAQEAQARRAAAPRKAARR